MNDDTKSLVAKEIRGFRETYKVSFFVWLKFVSVNARKNLKIYRELMFRVD